jgi:hypothetical protein
MLPVNEYGVNRSQQYPREQKPEIVKTAGEDETKEGCGGEVEML